MAITVPGYGRGNDVGSRIWHGHNLSSSYSAQGGTYMRTVVSQPPAGRGSTHLLSAGPLRAWPSRRVVKTGTEDRAGIPIGSFPAARPVGCLPVRD